MSTVRVLLADDQITVRSALRLLLEQEPDIQVVGEAAGATGLLRLIENAAPDLVLLDWELPGLPPTQLVRLLRYERPHMKIVALSGRPEAHRAALKAGVDAFISKSALPEQVLISLRQLFNSETEAKST